MHEPQYQSLSLILTPEFDDSGSGTAISFSFDIESPNLDVLQVLVWMNTKRASVPTQRYDGDAIQATDESGALALEIIDQGSRRTWVVKRPTAGTVNLKFKALPRKVDAKTPIGPRIDLRAEQGGLQGSTLSMIPVPPDTVEKNRKIYRIVLSWDLSRAPKGTRAVWTFGEGPGPRQRIGPLIELSSTWIMVGDVKSYSPPRDSDGNEKDFYGFYYFGELPLNISGTAHVNHQLFLKMSEFFQDPPSTENPYRVFVRRVTPARGFGGAAFTRGYILEYDASASSVTPDEISYLLSHEIVHNWPLLEYNFQAAGYVDQNSWYNEGIADYYGSLLPFRFGLCSASSLLAQVNGNMLAYFLNPFLNISNREAQENAWRGSSSYLTLPYKRGFSYFLKVDAMIRATSGGKRSLDDLVLELYRRRKSHQYYGPEVWLSLLEAELGRLGVEAHDDMEAGKTVLPPRDCLGPAFMLVRQDKEPLDLGFDEASLITRVVAGLKPGSRAAEAGVRDGDEIVENTFVWQLTGDYEREMKLKVQRGDEVMDFLYWPRGLEKLECWQWVET